MLLLLREFLESHLAYRFVVRLGVNGIDVGDKCLSEALYPSGSQTSTPDAVTAVLQTLSLAPRGIVLYVLAKSRFDRDDAPDRDDMRAVASLLGGWGLGLLMAGRSRST